MGGDPTTRLTLQPEATNRLRNRTRASFTASAPASVGAALLTVRSLQRAAILTSNLLIAESFQACLETSTACRLRYQRFHAFQICQRLFECKVSLLSPVGHKCGAARANLRRGKARPTVDRFLQA